MKKSNKRVATAVSDVKRASDYLIVCDFGELIGLEVRLPDAAKKLLETEAASPHPFSRDPSSLPSCPL